MKFQLNKKMSLKSEAIFEKIQNRLTKINPEKRELTHIYKCKITVGGKVVKTWMLDLKNVKLYVGDDDAECTLTCEDDVFFDVISGKLDAKEAKEQGKLIIDGELNYGLKLLPYISTL